MPAHKMTRHEMKEDELVTAVDRLSAYLAQNPAVLRNAAIAAGAVFVACVGLYWYVQSRAASAAELLQVGQARFTAELVASGSNPTAPVPTYASEAERDRAALEAFDQLATRHGGRKEGRLARYYQGILLSRLGRAPEAASAFERFLAKSPPPVLAGVAKAQLAQLRAQAGNAEEAAKIYSEMAEDEKSAFPRDWALYYLGQTLEQQGKSEDARTTYRKVLTEFPNSPMAYEAGRKVEGSPSS